MARHPTKKTLKDEHAQLKRSKEGRDYLAVEKARIERIVYLKHNEVKLIRKYIVLTNSKLKNLHTKIKTKFYI